MPSMLTRLFDAILDAECHTEQETANFLRLGRGWLGWLMRGIYPHGLVMAIFGCWDLGRVSPKFVPPKNQQALVRLQLLSAVQHMHERLPFLLWGRMGRDGGMSAGMTDLEKGHSSRKESQARGRSLILL